MGRSVTRRRLSVTRQTITAAVSAVTFLAFSAVLLLVPVPYVMYSPGSAYDIYAPEESGDGTSDHDAPAVSVHGTTTYPVTGELRMTTVSVTRADAELRLPEVLYGYLSPSRDVLPRAMLYPESKSAEQVESEEREMMDTSQQESIIAALRAAGQHVEELPVVESVVTGGPADGQLAPGDFVLAVDGEPVTDTAQVPERVRGHAVGDEVTFTILSAEAADRQQTDEVRVPVAADSDGQPRVGISVALGYRHDAQVHFGVKDSIRGPSAGLIFALGIYDQLTPGALIDGRDVAGTGTIDVDGNVGPIGGIREKIHGASDAGAELFLVPADNCADIVGLRTDLDLIRVETLDGAIRALEGGPVPRC